MVPYIWTAPTAWFQGGTGPNSEDSPCPSVTCYWFSVEGFYLTVFEHQTPVGKPLIALSIEPQFSQQFFVGCWTELMTPELWYKFGNFLPYWFWEKQVRSFNLPPSLVASVLIMEPNARGLHDLECLMTFLVPTKFQCCSYLVGQAMKMNSLTHSLRFPMKP